MDGAFTAGGALADSGLEETLQTLAARARGRLGAIDGDRVAAHVVHATPGADWAVRRAALDALARRFAFAERDALRVVKRPPRRQVLGTYRVARKGARKGARGGARSYDVTLAGVEPLRTSCGCADFVRSSLGLCKHGLVVLDLLEKRGALRKASEAPPAARESDALTWAFGHPLKGPADRLARLALASEKSARSAKRKGAFGFVDGRPRRDILARASARARFASELERAIQKGALTAEPSVIRLLSEERERAEARAACEDSARVAMRSLSRLKRKLYPYQREGVRRFLESGRLLLADDMGLGKTTQAIAGCHGLFESGLAKRGLLIVPAALKAQWKREWDATTGAPLGLVEGSPKERHRLYANVKRGFLVIGYEQLLRDFEHVRRFAPELVVLDEAQRIKNWATKSAAYVKALRPAYRLVLTGTPMENRFDELASIMDFVDDVALEPKWRLAPWHSRAEGDGHRGMAGARNLETLRERLSGAMLRRVRAEVLSQLPPRTDVRVPVELTEAQRMRHDELIPPIASLVRRASVRPLTQAEFLRLMQLLTAQRMICNGLAQVDFESEWRRCLDASEDTGPVIERLASPKLAALRGLIAQVVIGQGRKAVVFSQWRNMLRLAEWSVRDLLAEAGMRAVFFTGAESADKRERAIVDLHDDETATVMFLSDAGGVGLNLQRAANCCINLELPWNPAVLEQRIGRIHRLGQDSPIDVYNLVTEDGIESRIATLVAQKRAVFATLFDGTSDEVRFEGDGSFLGGVKKLVDIVEVPADVGADEHEDVPSLPNDSGAPAGPRTREEHPAGSTTRKSAAEPASVGPGEEASPASLLAGLSLSRLPDGGLRVEAPPELAAPLADFFESLARTLRSTAS